MLKRLFDLLVSITGLLLISPLFIILMILVRVKMGSPVFFIQERPGRNGKPFKMYKFRSMTNDRDEKGNLLPKYKRLTPFGLFLRSTSLDELPELFNVLKGEMSLVGPRPLRMHYLPRYNAFQMRRHEVRPGITGWAQVNGRNSLSWEEKFQMDVWYVDNRSMLLDLKILFYTVYKVLKREDVSRSEVETMPEFMGTPKKEQI